MKDNGRLHHLRNPRNSCFWLDRTANAKKDNRQEQISLDDSKLEDNRTNWNAFAWTAPGVQNEGEAPAPLQSDQAHTEISKHGQEPRIGEIDGRGVDAGERFNRGALRNDFRQTSPSGGYIPSDQQFYGDQPKISNLGHSRTGRDPRQALRPLIQVLRAFARVSSISNLIFRGKLKICVIRVREAPHTEVKEQRRKRPPLHQVSRFPPDLGQIEYRSPAEVFRLGCCS